MSKLPTDYQNFIYTSRYARWRPEDKRREVWPETVDRYVNWIFDEVKAKQGVDLSAHKPAVQDMILNLDVMPSMRCLLTAGPALERNHVAGYNCAYLPVDNLRAFDETLYILMCGTGVGFSVERRYTNKLPTIAGLNGDKAFLIVDDSKEGWASALNHLITNLYAGYEVTWDVGLIRPAGTRLKTFGGWASGPEPLVELFEFTTKMINNARGRKLTPLECHDLICKIASMVVVGGVRRSALISLSDLDDDEMRDCKSGQWWVDNPQRALANISAVYESTPSREVFDREWTALRLSGSGERGIFNRAASVAQAARNGRRDTEYEFGTNPCSEIILRPFQFCNLSEVVVRPDDGIMSLMAKVVVASLLGTMQATLTDFKYLRSIWKINTEQERLLGVSLTGQFDNPQLAGDKELLQRLKEVAINTNQHFAKRLGIKFATAVTCVKPSGTVSQLVDCASGLHPRHSKYYVRTVRVSNGDPLCKFLKKEGVPSEPDKYTADTTVFSFPVESPDGSVMRDQLGAIEHLEWWLGNQTYWCEHKPSVTISVRQEEWKPLGDAIYENFDKISGVSFLPYSEHTYEQAPYQEIDHVQYEVLKQKMPQIDWGKLVKFEKSDQTTGTQEYACTAGLCEVL